MVVVNPIRAGSAARSSSSSGTRVYIGLGSNVGARERNLARALGKLRRVPGLRLIRVSHVYETSPFGGPPQRNFLNAVVSAACRSSPEDLLRSLERIEKRAGRKKTVRWGPRVIDLDILLYGRLCRDSHRLQLPHPRLEERRFVLEPLSELAPRLVHPRVGKTMKRLLEEVLEDSGPPRYDQPFSKRVRMSLSRFVGDGKPRRN